MARLDQIAELRLRGFVPHWEIGEESLHLEWLPADEPARHVVLYYLERIRILMFVGLTYIAKSRG